MSHSSQSRTKDAGQFDNTLIIVASDNGPTARGVYYKDGHVSPGSAGALRGRKGSLYEGGIRQPLILSWPQGITRPGRDDTTVADGVDLLPTLASIAGISPPAAIPGTDLAPLLKGQAIKARPQLYWAFGLPGAAKQPGGPFPEQDRAPRLAVREGKWKLLAEPDGSNVQLYDLERDPNETRDLGGEQPRLRARLTQQLLAWAGKLPKP